MACWQCIILSGITTLTITDQSVFLCYLIRECYYQGNLVISTHWGINNCTQSHICSEISTDYLLIGANPQLINGCYLVVSSPAIVILAPKFALISQFCSPTLSEGKKGDYGIVSICSFVHSVVCPFIWTKLCRCRNSATTGPIHSKSLETSWPVDVQRHAHLPVGPLKPCSECGGPPAICLLIDVKFQPRGFVIRCAIKFNQGLQMCPILSSAWFQFPKSFANR